MIKLPKDIYGLNVIKSGLSAFADLGDFELFEEEKHYCIKVKNSRYDPTITLKEFENYLLDLINAKGIL